MRISTQTKKLKERIKTERKYKENHLILPIEDIKPELLVKKSDHKTQKQKFMEDLELFKTLLNLIENGATGFDLAYEVEKNQYVKKLIYDGILFYNTFLEIGNDKFIEAPDIKKKDYSHFKTVEQTEKQLFMMWLNEEIDKRETILKESEKYEEYIKNREKLIQKYLFCENCGAKIKDRYQHYCEKCGFKLN
jgi:ribosomal protein S27AE